MGARGPQPTPDGILELRGSNRAGRRGAEPQPDRRPPRVPTWLPKTMRAVFRELCRQLADMGILGTCDRNLVARYVQVMHRWLQAEAFMNEHGQTYVVRGRPKRQKDGTVVEGPVLGVRIYPHVKISKALTAQLLQMEDRMGLSPAARARLAGTVGLGQNAPGVPDADSAFFAAG